MTDSNDMNKWRQLATIAFQIANPRDFDGQELIERALKAAADAFPCGPSDYPHASPALAVGAFVAALREALDDLWTPRAEPRVRGDEGITLGDEGIEW
jgi:hypothetical protein